MQVRIRLEVEGDIKPLIAQNKHILPAVDDSRVVVGVYDLVQEALYLNSASWLHDGDKLDLVLPKEEVQS